jgi:microcystin-dependent protein
MSGLKTFKRLDDQERRIRQLERVEDGGDEGGGLPVGAVTAWLTATAPTGWLLCNGAAIPAQYTELIALIGATTPDLRGRMPIGVGGGGPSSLGATGGTWSHQHTQTGHVHSIASTGTQTTTQTGSSHTHVVPNITSSGSHTHNITGQAAGTSASVGTAAGTTITKGSYDGHAHGGDTGSTGAAHTHTVSDANTTGSGHDHTLAAHTHGGETGSGTGSTIPSDGPTAAANPPYYALNFIVKAE